MDFLKGVCRKVLPKRISAKAIPHRVTGFGEIDFRHILCTIGYSFHHTSATRVSIREGRCKKYGRTKKTSQDI